MYMQKRTWEDVSSMVCSQFDVIKDFPTSKLAQQVHKSAVIGKF